MKTGIIYCWTNVKNGKKYVGQTINESQRKRNHLHEAMVCQSDFYFHRALRKHGLESFIYEVVESDIEHCCLNERENHYINNYDTLWPHGYNQCLANSLSENSISKMKETKRKQFAAMSEEERKELTRKMCEGNKGRVRSDDTKKKQSESMKTYLRENPRIRSEETKRKISESLKRTKNKKGGD